MKIKSLFLSAGALLLAVAFSFCTKEAQTTLPEQADTAAVDRGVCTVTVQVIGGSVDVCGTQTNATICSNVAGVNLFGTDFIANNGIVTYTLTTPTQLRFTRNPSLPSTAKMSVQVSTPTGIKKYPVPVAGAAVAVIDNNCVPL